MEFMILRRSDRRTGQGAVPLPVERGVFLQPDALRLLRRNGQWQMAEGPFPTAELVAGFTVIEADSLREAAERVRRWPVTDEGAVLEIRAAGCSGGCTGIDEHGTAAGTLPRRDPALTRYVVFIRSAEHDECDLAPPPECIDVMNSYNEQAVRAGELLAGEGLKSSGLGARVRYADGASTVTDGPFTEVKELIAGYWMVQAASPEAAFAWVQRYPYPTGGDLTLELRVVCEVADPASAPAAGVAFTPEQRLAEQRMRAVQLEAGMRQALCGGAARPSGGTGN